MLPLLALATIVVTAAAPAPVTGFDSEEEAAVTILQMAYEHLPYYEIGGVIVRLSNGRYGAGRPHTDFSGHTVDINEDPSDYQGVIVATYHTHPCLDKTHLPSMFSDEDMKSERITGHDGFMADLCTGKVRRSSPLGPQEGVVIGTFPVVYKSLEQ